MPNSTTNYGYNKPLVNDATDADLWGGQLNTNWDDIDTDLKTVSDKTDGIAIIGMVAPYAGSTAPTKWILCYGQAISRITYSALFAIIGTTYGVGDGSTTFNLPDLRGRAVAGKDDMGGSAASRLTSGSKAAIDGTSLGASGGDEEHTLSTNELPAHNHTKSSYTVASNVGGTATYPVFDSVGLTSKAYDFTQNTGGSEAHNNVQPTIVLNYIIYAGA